MAHYWAMAHRLKTSDLDVCRCFISTNVSTPVNLFISCVHLNTQQINSSEEIDFNVTVIQVEKKPSAQCIHEIKNSLVQRYL